MVLLSILLRVHCRGTATAAAAAAAGRVRVSSWVQKTLTILSCRLACWLYHLLCVLLCCNTHRGHSVGWLHQPLLPHNTAGGVGWLLQTCRPALSLTCTDWFSTCTSVPTKMQQQQQGARNRLS